MTMLFERVLSKISSFASFKDGRKATSKNIKNAISKKSKKTAIASEVFSDSDESVFSDDEENEVIGYSTFGNHHVNAASSTSVKGKKRARESEDSDSSTSSDVISSVNGSSSKRVKLEDGAFDIVSDSASKKEVRFHADTMDNWRWADRNLHDLRATLHTQAVLDALSQDTSSDALSPDASSSSQTPLIATSNPKSLSSANLYRFHESHPEICGELGTELPPSSENPSAKEGPEYASTCAAKGYGSPAPSLCYDVDPPSRSPSPDSRREAQGSVQDGVLDDSEEEEDPDMILKGAPTPLSSPTLPSHPITCPPPSTKLRPLMKIPSPYNPKSMSSPLSPTEVQTLMTQLRSLDSATQSIVDKITQHRSLEAWRSGFQVGIHTQLTARALAAASEGEGQAKLLGQSPSKGLCQSDLSSVDKKIMKCSEKGKGRRWTIIGKDELVKNHRGWMVKDAAKAAKVRARSRGKGPRKPSCSAPKPKVQGRLSDLEDDSDVASFKSDSS